MSNKTYHQIFWMTWMVFNLFAAVVCGFMTLGFAMSGVVIFSHMFAILFVWCGVLSFYCSNKLVLVDTKFDKSVN